MLSPYYINEALTEAKKATAALVRPNPLVGAVLVDSSGKIVGRGYHHKFGEAHAEVNAFNDAIKNGASLHDCTLYVTLEPCSHHGKTPPCTNLILEQGVKKVVVGSLDPNPLVNGIELLKDCGVEVILEQNQEIIDLNSVFYVNQREERPYFQYKLAFSSDGVYASKNEQRFWISGTHAKQFVHEKLRADADAILSTARSVLNDDAKLNVRYNGQEKEKTAIIIDPNLELLLDKNTAATIFYPRQFSKLIIATSSAESLKKLPSYIEILHLPLSPASLEVDLIALAKYLYSQGCYKILVESGNGLFKRLLNNNLIDECQFIVSNNFLGGSDKLQYFSSAPAIVDDSNLEGFRLVQKKKLGDDELYQFLKK